MDKIYTVKEFSSKSFFVKKITTTKNQKDPQSIFDYILWRQGRYVRSNRTWETYLHTLYCISFKFGCSRFCPYWDLVEKSFFCLATGNGQMEMIKFKNKYFLYIYLRYLTVHQINKIFNIRRFFFKLINMFICLNDKMQSVTHIFNQISILHISFAS